MSVEPCLCCESPLVVPQALDAGQGILCDPCGNDIKDDFSAMWIDFGGEG